MEECDQKVCNVSDQFGITIPCPSIYFLEVEARVLLKVATKVSPRGKTNSENSDFWVAFLKKKRRSATKTFEISLINLASL